jgi:hypothetical protein
MHPGSRIRDGKNSNLRSGIQDGKIGSRILDQGWETFGSGIQDPGLTFQISKTGNFVAKFART